MKNPRLTGGKTHAHKEASYTAKKHSAKQDAPNYTDPLIVLAVGLLMLFGVQA